MKKADREQAKEHVLSMHETSKNMVPSPNNGIIRNQPSVPSNLSTNQQQNNKQPSMLATLSQKVPNNNQPTMLSRTANKEPSNNQPSMLPILSDNVPNNKQSLVLSTLPSSETIETHKRPVPNIELNSSSSKSAQINTAQTSPQPPQLIHHSNTNKNLDISDFVESFFQKDKIMQKQIIATILADQRASDILPPLTSVHTNISASSNNPFHNNQMNTNDSSSLYKPLNGNSFHWYSPGYREGQHRSLESTNQHAEFNIFSVAKKALNHIASQINNYIMNLDLGVEQRRLALWTSFSLPGMREIVQSFGFNTDNMGIGLMIASNISRFMKYTRTTSNRYARLPDAQQVAVRAITASCMPTPPTTPEKELGKQQWPDTTTGRKLLNYLGIPEGSSHILVRCGAIRRAVKDNLEKAFDFWDRGGDGTSLD